MGAMTSSCCSDSSHLKSPRMSLRAEEPETDLHDEQQLILQQQGCSKRRPGIPGESMQNTAVRQFQKPVYHKDVTAEALISNVMKTDPKLQVLFGHLGPSATHDIVNAFKERSARKGENLIRQGDEGDCLYIIDTGEVSIFVARPDADGEIKAGKLGREVVRLGPRKLFGELALLYSAPRAATAVVASERCRLWQLDREPFKMLLAQTSQATHELYEGWLSEVDIFKALNRYELSRLSDLLQSDFFDEGEAIITQGEQGDKFFILEDGTCSAFIKGPDGEKEVKQYTKQGEYFGEIGLLKQEPRKATVRATGQGATILSLSKEDFTCTLGPIEDILRANIDKYPQYAQFVQMA